MPETRQMKKTAPPTPLTPKPCSRKRGAPNAGNVRTRSKRTRGETSTLPRVLISEESFTAEGLRASPTPIDPSHSGSCSEVVNNVALAISPAGALTSDAQLRTPSASPDPTSRERTPGDGRAPREPTRKETVRARLKGVVKIVIRQNIIRRLTAAFARPPPSNGQLKLCGPCARLNLVSEDFIVGRGDKPYTTASQRHGTFIGIYVKAHVCSFCRLVMKSIAEQPFAKLSGVVVYGQQQGSTVALMSAVCMVTWQVDGFFGQMHKTRRLEISWSDPCYETMYIVMVSPKRSLTERQSDPAPHAFLGREIAHVNKTKTDLINKWFKVCRKNHEGCRPVKGHKFQELRRSAFFGVIDVKEMRLRSLPEGADYVALSYQWGPEDKRFLTTRETVRSITERNGLAHFLDRLPATIKETIELVRVLDLQFLWVDSLCIVQDADDAWDRNATVMDLVYGNAVLTICAADGEDAYAGLCAISKPEMRAAQAIEPYNSNLSLMARYPCEVYVKQSHWNTRAWTFQERLLSKRCLLFTQGRVYFQCRETTMCEDLHMEAEQIGASLDVEGSPGEDLKKFAKNPVKAYEVNVALYTARQLTKSGDILTAFYGIANLLCNQLGGDSVYGLPSSHFDWALLWDPADAPLRRKPKESMSFPSWSWCGWDKRIMEYKDYAVKDIDMHLSSWLAEHTWITWYIRDGNGDLRLVWDAKSCKPLCKAEPGSKYCGYSKADELSDPRYDHYGRRISDCMMGLERNEFKRTILEFPLQVRTLEPGEKSAITVGSPDRSILQFWTWSAYFYLHPQDLQEPFREDTSLQGRILSRRFSILDAHRTWAGTIVLDKKWKFDSSKPQHFIAISDALRFFYTKEGTIHSNYSRTDKEWPLYNVLLLGYDEMNQQNGASPETGGCPGQIAYRVGLGKIYQDAFDQACETSHQSQRKEWREIVLG